MTAVANSSDPAQQSQLSLSQMLCVMRVEYHRAMSQRYPICCLMIAIDGLDKMTERHGYTLKQRIMRSTYDLLRSASRKEAFIGMALMSGDRIMAVFPNTPPSRLADLGEILNGNSKSLKITAHGKNLPLSLSLGASHSLHEETSTFESFVEKAGRALAIAREAGGGRYFMWREAEAQLDELRDELQQQTKAFKKQHAELVEEASDFSGLQQAAVIDQFQQIFSTVNRTPEIARLEKEVLALAAKELHEERQKAVQAQVAEHQNQIDLLERRIAKLTDMLGVTESELKRVMKMKAIDPGVASIYRTVQGLGEDDDNAEVKKAMMVDIFEANMAFRSRGSS